MTRIVRAGRKVLPAEVLDARARAEELLREAEARADALLSDARAEAEKLREVARREAREEGRAEAAGQLVRAHAIVDRAREESEADLKRLAVAAAERLVHAELALHPERVRDVVRGVLERAKRATRLVLVVHPEDRASIADLPELVGARLEEDESLERGDCVARTDLGTLDGRLVVRLDALRRALGT
ncbi:MAG: hypothetical protein H6722_08500 [Sandaracinus sp.]|nr:hypothetical protein [Sandaracinus sp.]MCB9619067.1 hypothetical protein [Sandaracinus sp.]